MAGKGIGLKTVELLCKENHVISVSRNLTPELEQLNTRFFELDITSDNFEILNNLPDEIHGLVSFLISDSNCWMTGQIIGVDGGMGSLKV